MMKRYLCLALAIIFCLTGIPVFALTDEDMAEYGHFDIVDYYVPNEKETGYDVIRYAKESSTYTDLSDADARKVSVLSALGLADAFGEGDTFRPDEVITRGEFAALTVALVKADSYPKDERIHFTDVPSDHPHFDAVTAAAAYGIIGGYSDGTFRPDDAIVYEDAVSLLLKALGYRVAAELDGGWSIGYMTTANRIGLIKGVSAQTTAFLTRGEVARILYNALDCPIFRGVSYGDLVRYEADEDRTVLAEYHDTYTVKDYVNATFVSALAGYSPTNTTHIRIGNESYSVAAKAYAEYLGYYVEAYYRDEEKGTKEILYLAPEENTEKLVIKAEDITNFNDLTYYYGTKSKARIDPNHSLIINGVRIAEYDNSTFIPENGDVILLSRKGTTYDTVLINTYHSFLLKSTVTDRDGYVVFEPQYSQPSFRIDVNGNDKQAFSVYMDDKKLDYYAEPRDIYNADGIMIHQLVIPELPVYSVFNIFADKYDTVRGVKVPAKDASFVKIVISTQTAVGSAAAFSEEEITLSNGEEGTETTYPLSPENQLDLHKTDYTLGLEGTFYFDYDGRIFAWTNTTGGDQYIMGEDGKKILVTESNLTVGLVYGYLIKTNQTGGLGNVLQAKILDMDGTINIYPFAKKVIVNGEPFSDPDVIEGKLSEAARLANPTFTISQLFKYQLNSSGQIREVQTLLQSIGLPEDAEEDHLRREHERAEFTSRSEWGWILWPSSGPYAKLPLYNGEARQFFKVPSVETFEEEDYSTPAEWYPNNTAKTVEVYDCDEVLVPNVVVEYADPIGIYDYPYVMVQRVTKGVDEEGNAVDILYFAGLAGDPVLDNPYTIEERRRNPGEEQNTLGGTAKFYAKEEGLFDGLACGDLIKIYGKNRYISNWEMVLSLEDAKNFDLSKYPTALPAREKWNMYEVYSVIEARKRILMVQRGKLTSDGKREYQQLNPFEGTLGVILYDASGREPEVTYWSNAQLLDQARQVGNEKASRVYIWETNVTMKLLVGYIGL